MRRASFRPCILLLTVLTAAMVGPAALGAATQAADTRPAGDGSTAPLDRFLEGLHSLRTRFTQTVTGAHGRIVAQVTGELIVLRPGRFRWESHPVGGNGAARSGAGQSAAGPSGAGPSGAGPGSAEQLLVADGRNLWYYDADLQQVTVRPQSTALTATPAMLLSGGTSVLDAFQLSGAGSKDGLEWVQVVPKKTDADFTEALFGFSGNELERMILKDKLGQTASLTFQDAERNVPVAPSEVSFTPPAGADVIGTPQK